MHRSIRLWLLCLSVAATPSCMGPLLEISPALLPNGVEGDSYRQELVADADDDVTWTISTGILPPDLDLSADAGVLSGIPTIPGVFEFTVSASDNPPFPRSGRQRYAITIIERLTLDAGLEEAKVDQPYDDGFDAVVTIRRSIGDDEATVSAAITGPNGREVELEEGQAVLVNGQALTGPDGDGNYGRTIPAASQYTVTVNEPTRGQEETVITPPADFEATSPQEDGTVSLPVSQWNGRMPTRVWRSKSC